MLQFLLGRAGSGKTEYIRQMLVDKSLQGEKNLILLVPEQYTFEMEKDILQRTGPRQAEAVSVLSFTRLAEAVFRQEGGRQGNRLSDGGRRILMSRAVSACEEHLEVYAKGAKNNQLTELMLTAVNELKLCGVNPQQLRETGALLGGTGLSKKLSELSLIYDTYEALVQSSYLDPRDDLTRLYQQLEDSSFFCGRVVAVDSFEGFTAQEFKVLEQIMRKARTVVVSLCTDGLEDDEVGLFALVNRTQRKLRQTARENGIPIAPPITLWETPRFKNASLRLLEEQLFCARETRKEEGVEGVEIFSAPDCYGESEWVAATIRRLVREDGYRYRDFSIVCRTPERYYGCLDGALRKRDIPCFVSAPEQVDAQPVMRFVLLAFEAVQSGYSTDDLLNLLKTGVSGFKTDEIAQLENYAFLWRISGAAWKEPFQRHPEGFGQGFTDESSLALHEINMLRERLMRPLLRFAEKTRDATGEEICRAVYRLLTDFSMEETLPRYCEALEETGENALAARQLRVWELLMELLGQMYAILGDRKIPRERFGRLLREVVAGEDVSDIPQRADEVLFGTPEQVRQSTPKAVFLLGAAQGDFPLAPRSSGVFSDAERRELISLQLPLGDPLEQKNIEERYLAYSVACLPSEKLFLSYPRLAEGEEKEPGELVSGILAVFPQLRETRGIPLSYTADSARSAFSQMSARFTEQSGEAAALRAYFEGRADYAGRVEALRRAVGGCGEELRDKDLARRFFGEQTFLSPTQVEIYHSCSFRYFCRYGLGAKERRPAEVDVMQYGTLMHYLFENFFMLEPRERSALTADGLRELVDGLIDRYVKENMGGFQLLSGRETYRLGRMAQSACKLIEHMEKELKQSSFTPAYFELALGKGRVPPLKIPVREGTMVTVGGTIDRVDLYQGSGGKRYVRVVDYKTGKKEFRLGDVLYGLNMQMLIYLAALSEAGVALPAGILYMPAAEPTVSAQRGEDENKIRQEAEKQLRMSGMLLSDAEIINAMEEGAKGKYIPASLKKDGTFSKTSSVLENEELVQVLSYVKRLIATMARELAEGKVPARPNLKNSLACRYCPYGAVCGREYGEKDIEKERLSTEEALARMKEEGGDIHGGHDLDTGAAGRY